MELKNQQILLGAIACGGLIVVAAYYAARPELLVLSAAFFTLSILVYRWGYFLGPSLTALFSKWSDISQYSLSPQQDVLVKKTPDGYYASAFLSISLSGSSRGGAAAQSMFETALSTLGHTTKISLIVSNLDVSDFVERLSEKRSLAEHKRSSLKSGSAQAEVLDRQIQNYTAQINRLSGGERPMQVVAYAQTTAFAPTKSQATDTVRAQAKEVAAVLASSLGCPVAPLTGDELLACVEWEIISPASRQQIAGRLA